MAKSILKRRDRRDAATAKKQNKNFKGFSYENGERFAVFTNTGI